MTEPAFLNERSSRRTSIFGLRLWVVVGIGVGATIVIALFLVSLCFTSRRNATRSKSCSNKKKKKQRREPALRPIKSVASQAKPNIPSVSKEILQIRVDHTREPEPDPHALALVPQPKEETPTRLHMEIVKDHRISYPERPGSGGSGQVEQAVSATAMPDVSHLGWGHWYTLRELQVSTEEFADEKVIGEGGYGIVYRGVLEDGGSHSKNSDHLDFEHFFPKSGPHPLISLSPSPHLFLVRSDPANRSQRFLRRRSDRGVSG